VFFDFKLGRSLNKNSSLSSIIRTIILCVFLDARKNNENKLNLYMQSNLKVQNFNELLHIELRN
jgi:hypothetical protein